MTTTHWIFVYGTLLQGEHNHRVIAGARRIGGAALEGAYELRDLGPFPGLVVTGTGERGKVWGELYEVDDAGLAAVDRLEGHPHFYRRRRVQLTNGANAWTYVLPREYAARAPRIAAGDWRRRGAEVASCG